MSPALIIYKKNRSAEMILPTDSIYALFVKRKAVQIDYTIQFPLISPIG